MPGFTFASQAILSTAAAKIGVPLIYQLWQQVYQQDADFRAVSSHSIGEKSKHIPTCKDMELDVGLNSSTQLGELPRLLVMVLLLSACNSLITTCTMNQMPLDERTYVTRKLRQAAPYIPRKLQQTFQCLQGLVELGVVQFTADK